MSSDPDTMVHPQCGTTLRRGVRPLTVRYGDLVAVIQAPGYYRDVEGPPAFTCSDLQVQTDARDALRAACND